MRAILKLLFLTAIFLALGAGQSDIWRRRPHGLAAGFDFSGDRLTSPTGHTMTLSASDATQAGRKITLSGGYTEIAGIPSIGSSFTICLWAKFAYPSDGIQNIGFANDPTTNRRSIALLYRPTNTPPVLQFAVSNDGTNFVIDYFFSYQIPDTNWQHLTLAFDSAAAAGTRGKLWINSTEIPVMTINNDTSGHAVYFADLPWHLSTPYSVNRFQGNVADFRIYSRALTAAEINQIYAFGKTRIDAGGTP